MSIDIKNKGQAVKNLIRLSSHLEEYKDAYFHPFKYEIIHLIEDFKRNNKKLPNKVQMEIFANIGYLESNRRWKALEMNDFAR